MDNAPQETSFFFFWISREGENFPGSQVQQGGFSHLQKMPGVEMLAIKDFQGVGPSPELLAHPKELCPRKNEEF